MGELVGKDRGSVRQSRGRPGSIVNVVANHAAEVERDEVIGYIFTHWDCPKCGEDCREEGDISSESASCKYCGCEVNIREVR